MKTENATWCRTVDSFGNLTSRQLQNNIELSFRKRKRTGLEHLINKNFLFAKRMKTYRPKYHNLMTQQLPILGHTNHMHMLIKGN